MSGRSKRLGEERLDPIPNAPDIYGWSGQNLLSIIQVSHIEATKSSKVRKRIAKANCKMNWDGNVQATWLESSMDYGWIDPGCHFVQSKRQAASRVLYISIVFGCVCLCHQLDVR